jgi:undecaprenyl-phosphate galactose phosphotransferase/putative colanic acid biosynthesis UDP-glucose lipid carrier transferase
MTASHELGAAARAAGVRPFDVSGTEAVSVASLAIDALLIIATSIATGVIYHLIDLQRVGDPVVFLGTGAFVAAVFCGVTRILGTAKGLQVSTALGRARIAVTVWGSTFLFLAFLAFSLKIGAGFSRGAVLSFAFAGLGVVVLSRVFTPRLLAQAGATGAHRGHEVVVLAAAGELERHVLMEALRREGCSEIKLIEFDAHCDTIGWVSERKLLLERVLEAARVSGPGEIYIFAPTLSQERIQSVMSGLRLVPRAIYVVPNESVAQLLRYSVRAVGSTVAIEMQKAPLSTAERAVKRAIDIVVALAATLFVFPLFATIAIAIKLDSSGPVLFRQNRNGYRGEPFRIFKFRTMTVMEDGGIVVQASRNDQRVTRIGRFLRRTSLDELPQLFNVLSGEMSLVGPRPHALAHDELYARMIENYALRQHVKPGITGWAQVNGYRGETPTLDLMYRRIEYDLWYAANCSLPLDILILVRTVTVLWGQNTY